jgi:hypothetical protein
MLSQNPARTEGDNKNIYLLDIWYVRAGKNSKGKS